MQQGTIHKHHTKGKKMIMPLHEVYLMHLQCYTQLAINRKHIGICFVAHFDMRGKGTSCCCCCWPPSEYYYAVTIIYACLVECDMIMKDCLLRMFTDKKIIYRKYLCSCYSITSDSTRKCKGMTDTLSLKR